jgi:predicted transport protein
MQPLPDLNGVYESDHIKRVSETVGNLWSELRWRYEDLSDVTIYTNKSYIGMKRGHKLFGVFRLRKNHIGINITRGNIKIDGSKSRGFLELEDPKGMSEERSRVHRDGVMGHSSVIKFSKLDDLEYVVYLINQKYELIG